jgi:hypothetical protein
VPIIPYRRLQSAILPLAVWGLQAGCGTEPIDRPVLSHFAVGYYPGQLISATETCDHLVTHVLLVLSTAGTFELSANVQDDCTRSGGGFADGGVSRFGTYTRQAATLSFTSDSAAHPEFAGTLETGGIVLVFLPGLDGLASPVELRVPEIQTDS